MARLKLLPAVSEGMQRLRIFTSGLIGVALFAYLLFEESRVRGQEVVEFLLAGALGGAATFIFFTGIYWVISGFEKSRSPGGPPNLSKISTSPAYSQKVSGGLSSNRLSGKTLFAICEKASQELYSTITAEIAFPEKTGSSALDQVLESIPREWERISLAYCYGLLAICMVKKDRKFLESQYHAGLQSRVIGKMKLLTQVSLMQVSETGDPTRLLALESLELSKVVKCVNQFIERLLSKKGDPLVGMVAYFTEATGTAGYNKSAIIHTKSKELLASMLVSVDALVA